MWLPLTKIIPGYGKRKGRSIPPLGRLFPVQTHLQNMLHEFLTTITTIITTIIIRIVPSRTASLLLHLLS